MKKIISLVLVLVLIFSMAVPSFAAGDNDTELEALNSIDYWVYWTWSDFSNYFSDLLDDSGVIRSNLISAVDYLNISQMNLTDIASYNFNMLAELQKLNRNLFGNTTWLTSFGETVTGSLSNISGGLQSLVNVFADPEDLKLRDNQENNLISATDNFFTPGSGTSIESEDISGLAGLVSDFNSVFDVSTIVGNENPLDILNSNSDFSKWFSTETGLSMDPKFGSGSGGSGELFPPPDTESPYQGENLLPYATSNLVTDTVYNGKGFKNYAAFSPFGSGLKPFPENDVYSDSFSTTGYIEVEDGDILYLYNFNFIDCTTAVFYSESYDRDVIYSVNRLNYSEVNLPDVVDENGVFSITFSDNASHPVVAFRFQSSLITSASIITKNVYPLKGLEPEPDPEPIQTNWLPLATSIQGGSEIYNGKGWKENVRLSSGGAETSASGFYTTGFIPVTGGDVVYTKNILFYAVNGVGSRLYLYEDGSISYNNISSSSADSLGVFTFNIPDDVVAIRFVGSSMSDSSIITINQYPSVDAGEPVSYSLPSSVSLSAPEISYSDEIVTSYYQDRMNEFYSLIGGDSSG